MASLKILAIDDRPDNLTVLKAVVGDAFPGATVLTALNGPQGIELARAEDPDVILLDIVMPGMDGFEVCQKLKAEERLQPIPVVFLTALRTDPESRIRALKTGAEAFLSKPFNAQELMAQLQAMAKIKKANQLQRVEKERLSVLVAERTRELEKELSEHHRAKAALQQANQQLERNQLAMLNLLEDLKGENEARKKSEDRFRSISSAAQDAVIMMDGLGDVSFWNDAAVRMFGYSDREAIGRHLHQLIVPERFHADFQKGMENFRATGQGEAIGKLVEFTALRKGGAEFPVEVSLAPVRQGEDWHAVGILRDITERKQLEERLLRAQRMESIGALAGGVAHDLNNILSPIMMSASMLRETVSPEMRDDLLSSIETAAQRGADIVNQVLTFARGVKGTHTLIRPESLIEEMGMIARETFPKSISLAADSRPGLWNVTGDQTQLHQVLMNLFVNARDAMPHGGALTLSAENIEVDGLYSATQPDAKAGRYVKFRVTDTGMGIEPGNLGKIFDPFFTTKGPTIGTGLGLSTVMGIVRSHGGFITVVSEVNKGTTFEVFIPASNKAAPAPERPKVSGLKSGDGELILLVDDEVEIVKVTKSILKLNGYTVLSASDGAEALACHAKHSAEIKLVVTDLMMPNMDGAAIVSALRQHSPALPIIVASGYGSEAVQNEMAGLNVQAFLKKPFDVAQLLQIIHETLHRQTT